MRKIIEKADLVKKEWDIEKKRLDEECEKVVAEKQASQSVIARFGKYILLLQTCKKKKE